MGWGTAVAVGAVALAGVAAASAGLLGTKKEPPQNDPSKDIPRETPPTRSEQTPAETAPGQGDVGRSPETSATKTSGTTFQKHGRCPSCHTEQDFHLISTIRRLAEGLKSMGVKPYQGLLGMAKSFFAVVFKGAKMTPELECTACHRHFVECPQCHTTTLLPVEHHFQQVHCANCTCLLDACERWPS
jgi:hypothetical protein